MFGFVTHCLQSKTFYGLVLQNNLSLSLYKPAPNCPERMSGGGVCISGFNQTRQVTASSQKKLFLRKNLLPGSCCSAILCCFNSL